VIRSAGAQGLRNTLSLVNLAKGLYFLTVTTDTGKRVEKLEVK